MKRLIAGAIALALASTPVIAQTMPKAPFWTDRGGHPQQATGVFLQNSDGSLAAVAKQESLVLASANVAAAAQMVYGGRYALAISCTTWAANGVTLRTRGPDGSTMMPAGQYSANTSIEVGVGSNAVVDVVVASGSAGCNATLSREPQ
jgi:hypothetical protein